MIAPFANLFGYILNFIYNIVNNYGLAIIIFFNFNKNNIITIINKTAKNNEKDHENTK